MKISGTVPPSRTSQAAMVDTRGRMWIVGGETFTHSRHIDMVAQFSPDFSNPDVQGKDFVFKIMIFFKLTLANLQSKMSIFQQGRAQDLNIFISSQIF